MRLRPSLNLLKIFNALIALGPAIFGLSSLLSFSVLYRNPAGGHFEIFSEAARLLWQHQDPYGRLWSSGWWFYSPSAGLFFFGLFSWLPARWGLLAYMLCSWLLFVVAARALLRMVSMDARGRGLFWLLISSEMTGALLNARLEVMLCGLLLGSIVLLLRKPSAVFLSAFALAAATNWKFQSFPAAALLALVWIYYRRNLRWPLAYAGFLVLWYAAPLLVFPWGFLATLHRHWRESLSADIAAAWLGFQHLYTLPIKFLGVPLSFASTQALSAACGFAMALWLLGWMRTKTESTVAWLLAASLGSAFALMFSPLSQSAAYILYAPLLLTALLPAYRQGWPLFAAWFFISLIHSDFMPAAYRPWVMEHALKPYGVLILLLSLWAQSARAAHQGSTSGARGGVTGS